MPTSKSVALPATRKWPFSWLDTLAVVGAALSVVDHYFIVLAAFEFLGPGLLSEWSGNRNKDEFEQTAIRRAGLHALMVVSIGLTLFIVARVARPYSAEQGIAVPDLLPATLVFSTLIVVYYLSRIISYWGPAIAARRVLRIYAALFFLSVVAAVLKRLIVLGRSDVWVGFLPVLAVPVAAWALSILVARRTRLTGMILVACSLGVLVPVVMAMDEGSWGWIADSILWTIVPPMVLGVALLWQGRQRGIEQDGQEEFG